jgi:hypothetical protein
MVATTTQDTFHPMRGHVHDGCIVSRRNGDMLTISGVMGGWALHTQDGVELGRNLCAHEVNALVIAHGITPRAAKLHRIAQIAAQCAPDHPRP